MSQALVNILLNIGGVILILIGVLAALLLLGTIFATVAGINRMSKRKDDEDE